MPCLEQECRSVQIPRPQLVFERDAEIADVDVVEAKHCNRSASSAETTRHECEQSVCFVLRASARILHLIHLNHQASTIDQSSIDNPHAQFSSQLVVLIK